MEPIIITLNEQKSFSRTYEPFEGEEFGYVLKGKVELHLGTKVFVLKEGECFYTSGQFGTIHSNLLFPFSKIVS